MSIAQAVGPRPHHVIALSGSSGSCIPLLYRRIVPDRREAPLPSPGRADAQPVACASSLAARSPRGVRNPGFVGEILGGRAETVGARCGGDRTRCRPAFR